MNILVISPHPDDETLGAGGTVRRLIAEGHKASWLNITNMNEKYTGGGQYSPQRVAQRAEEIQQVKEETGYALFYDLGLCPAGLENYPKQDIIGPMKAVLDEVRPEVVFLPYAHDAHSDHRIVYECAMACAKTFRAPYVKKVLCMDIISETNYTSQTFRPNLFVDISDYMEDKLRIAAIYRSEIQSAPFPRSLDAIRAQAAYMGSYCCSRYAEAFHIVKEIL